MDLPHVGDLIEISLGPFSPNEKKLPEGKVEVYSGGALFVTRLEPITKLGKSYRGKCCKSKPHLHIHLQTPSLIKLNAWLMWCEVIDVKKDGIWKTIAGWKQESFYKENKGNYGQRIWRTMLSKIGSFLRKVNDIRR